MEANTAAEIAPSSDRKVSLRDNFLRSKHPGKSAPEPAKVKGPAETPSVDNTLVCWRGLRVIVTFQSGRTLAGTLKYTSRFAFELDADGTVFTIFKHSVEHVCRDGAV